MTEDNVARTEIPFEERLIVSGTRLTRASGTALFRCLLVVTGFFVVSVASLLLKESESLVLLGSAVGTVILVVGFKADYLHPAVAFLVPWLVVLLFSAIPISAYARPLELQTCTFVITTIFVWLLVTFAARVVVGTQTSAIGPRSRVDIAIPNIRTAVIAGFILLYLFATFNVAYAGYIPLLSALATGNSGYATFGIPTVYGAFLAYANALGCLSFYLYSTSRDRRYLGLYLSVLCLHVLFLTRQNVVTLLVETFVIRCFAVKRISRIAIVTMLAVGLGAFSILGSLRSGDIKEIINVRGGFHWIPSGLIWLYAYSYFNVLNLENMISQSGAPYFDGSMWQNLLPSVLRPHTEHASYLQLAALNVSSYMYPIYLDVGAWGVRVWTAIWGALTAIAYQMAVRRGRFADIAVYGCLFFCGLLSFFVDFWFYLPVIFQLFFFYMFEAVLFRRAKPGGASVHV